MCFFINSSPLKRKILFFDIIILHFYFTCNLYLNKVKYFYEK
ncbi:MAG TPA: hypothetical protein DIU40_07970 [Ruminococcaceae bacterium]|nr:hypothetical protein [Oscillospiraceae bacterium]